MSHCLLHVRANQPADDSINLKSDIPKNPTTTTKKTDVALRLTKLTETFKQVKCIFKKKKPLLSYTTMRNKGVYICSSSKPINQTHVIPLGTYLHAYLSRSHANSLLFYTYEVCLWVLIADLIWRISLKEGIIQLCGLMSMSYEDPIFQMQLALQFLLGHNLLHRKRSMLK